jgi:hypothetical protein
LEQHRFNIYDYWPNTHFKVKTPDGITLELRRQVGAIREDDNPRIITLKPGETYVHVMQLDLWPAHTNWVDTSKPVRDLFAKAGEYMISAHYHYAPPVGLATWTAEFASTTVKLNVEKPDEWGAAAEGIKARLRLAKPTFKAGDSLEFDLDLKNSGNIAIEDTPIPFHCNIELDGNWYAYTKPIGYPAATIKLGPGRERVPHVKVTANKDWVFPAPWTDTGGPTPFELKAGKHKVRIGYPLPHVDSEKIKNSMVLSQVVEFEVGAGGKVPEPTLADAADRIVVATIDWKDGKPRLKPVRAIKGPNNRWQPEVQPITIAEGDEPLPADKPNQEWVLFLRAEEDEVEAPKLSPAAAKGWFRPADADEIKRVVAALPTLKETGPVKKNVSLGLRPSVTTVHVGDPIRLDVVLTNYGDAALRLLQLRYNVYDYWPLLAFTITLPDGKKVVLTRPDGVFKREDYVDEMELKKGESYSHTVRIDRWRVAGPQLREEIVLEALFRLPGTYKVEATYAATAGFKNINPTTEILDWPFWSGELLSNAATFEVKAAAKK